ncbi:IS1380 family transposase [Methanobrevibacter sp.]|uniref:IS1380 family transposase n=1 Tax=Methanobrevibacter sp. TaxID=66852 RepID=UPI00386A6A72
MSIVNTLSFESNRQIKINFSGGDLSSDAGLLLIKEFAAKIGFSKLIKNKFKTNDKSVRFHKDNENLMQMIYQIIAAYFEDDCADELTHDPVFQAILDKNALASQPTLSRFFNRMDEDTLRQFDDIDQRLRDIVYSIKHPEHILLDLDSTLLGTYGHQEGEGFNFHYQAHGYHPLLCYDGLTGDLLKAELRNGNLHCSNDAEKFIEPLLKEYMDRCMKTYLRGDSGFSSPKLYKTCECNGCSYAIRLKQNNSLIALAADKDEDLYKSTKGDQISYAVTYGEFMYQAGSWDYPRRVVFKIEKPYGQMIHMYTFIVTNMDMEPYQIIQFYCGRGKMENFIKEGKNGFDFASVSSRSKVVNANRMRIHMLAYNLFNWFRRMVLPANMRKQQINTIRLKLMKIAAKAVHSARYITFKLCSSCPYKKEFYKTLENIQHLNVQLE